MNAKDATTNQAAWRLGYIYINIPYISYIIIHLVIAVLIGPLYIPIL